MNLLPIARQSDVIIQDIDKELLIYNLKTNRTFSLNETSKIVYQHCDGQTSFTELKDKYHYSDDLIFLSLYQLKKHDLIEDDYASPFMGLSRREVIRKVGLASMFALPVISVLVAPAAAQAASCVNPGGLAPGDSVGSCFEPVATAVACNPTFCVRPAPGGVGACCSGGLTNAPGGCVTSGGTITCNCVCT